MQIGLMVATLPLLDINGKIYSFIDKGEYKLYIKAPTIFSMDLCRILLNEHLERLSLFDIISMNNIGASIFNMMDAGIYSGPYINFMK